MSPEIEVQNVIQSLPECRRSRRSCSWRSTSGPRSSRPSCSCPAWCRWRRRRCSGGTGSCTLAPATEPWQNGNTVDYMLGCAIPVTPFLVLIGRQACKLKFKLRELISYFCCVNLATRPLKQTAGAAAEQKQEVSSLNLNLSLQACWSQISENHTFSSFKF